MQETKDWRADPCQVTALRLSDIDDTVIEDPETYVWIDRTTMSLVEAVENAAIVNEAPDVHVPDALPSRVGAGRSVKSCIERAPAGIVRDEVN